MYVVEPTEDGQCVVRIGVLALNIALFDLPLLLIAHGSSSYKDAKNFHEEQYEGCRETVIASGVLAGGSEFEIAFHKAVKIYRMPSKLRSLV